MASVEVTAMLGPTHGRRVLSRAVGPVDGAEQAESHGGLATGVYPSGGASGGVAELVGMVVLLQMGRKRVGMARGRFVYDLVIISVHLLGRVVLPQKFLDADSAADHFPGVAPGGV